MKQDMVGQRFGRLIVIKEAAPQAVGRNREMRRCVECQCDCGTMKLVLTHSLRQGLTRSCGCLRRDTAGKMNAKHGMKGTNIQHPLYLVWRGIKTRCYNSKCRAFKDYGGRGIEISAEWKDDPEAFVSWCLANGWTPSLTIDRINNDGHYERGNCEFVSKSENSRRSNVNKRFRKTALLVVGFLSLPG